MAAQDGQTAARIELAHRVATGGEGNEVFLLGDGSRISRGGDDRVSGGDGDDAVDGDQTIGDIATGGDDRLDGGAHTDALNGDGGTDRCENGETLANCEL